MKTFSRLQLGPFVLFEEFARGGFGVVWRGRHQREGVPVAAKVLTALSARSADSIGSFRDEVRAAAGLDHAGIVSVYDYGTVDADAADASRGAVSPGSPYLVMELAQWGSLADVKTPMTWPVAKGVLLGLLDALAYAHARGIIHRDVKPRNVLVAGPAHRPVLKLADFGIAHAMNAQPGEVSGETAGTPNYMAPEQLRGGWRDLGPWTDLYAVGCVAHQLLTGTPPYARPNPLEVMTAHLEAPVPDPPPGLVLPPGAWAWVQGLLAKDHRRRAGCAADAADALDGIGADPEPLLVTMRMAASPSDPSTDPTEADRTALDPAPPTGVEASDDDHSVSVSLLPRRSLRMGDWRRATPLVPPAALRDAGLGLFGLRGVPLVGRERERDLLWSSLRTVIETRLPVVVLVEGPAGSGKSRLAEWLGERAHELGLASPLHARHAPTPEPGDGLVPMVARDVRAVGLYPDEVARRVAHLFELAPEDAAVESLTALLRTDRVEDMTLDAGWRRATTARVRLQSADERNVVLRQFLAMRAARRPLVVLVDDIVWGPDALEFVEQVLAWQPTGTFPVLFVLTARSEALAERPVEAARLEAMLRRPTVRRLELGPLSSAQQARLVGALLGFEAPLAAHLAERSAGNPQFAVQLVGDWVQRDLLEPGEHGFRLREGADLELPSDLQALWDARVEQVLSSFPFEDGVALEVAATLGHAPDPAQWAEVCRRLRLALPTDLLDALLAVRLARRQGDGTSGWRFEQGMFTEALLRRAARAGRAAALHRACAEMLEAQADDDAYRVEQLGRHRLAAGDPEAALAPLLDAARRRFEVGEYVKAQHCLAEHDRALEALAAGEADPRRVEGALLWCWIRRMLGDLRGAQRRFHEVEAAVLRAEPSVYRSQRDLLSGVLAFAAGQVANACSHLQRAEAAFAAEGDRRRLAQCRSELAKALLQAGALAEATAALQAALADFTELSDPHGEARCHMGLALLARAHGDLAAVEQRLAWARDGYERAGARLGVAETLNQLGDCARLRGDSARAVRFYVDSMQRFVELEAPSVDMVRANLAQALIDRGRHDDARVHLVASIDRFAHRGQPAMVAALRVVLLLCDAHDEDWGGFAQHLREGSAGLAETGFHDLDVARAARAAGLRAGDRRPDLAEAALRLARAQFEALDRKDEVQAVDVELARLRR